ncbi:MAG TPA: bifunctional aspartate transaminase/aspartate 4-decarboxylase [Streptosporangiaceae bacterium]|nr:bifunctional aspartate transaminase/aspartate 4-decarboxylase [Streptosporangiaceae bacterium]
MPVKDSTSRGRQRELESLSPFELKDTLIKLAGANVEREAVTMLNAGRGNPNWVATEPREAFFLLGKFALAESLLAWDEWPGVGGMPSKTGISKRLVAFLRKNRTEPGAELLERSLEYATKTLGLGADAFVHEMADSVIGDNYPVPDRMLRCFEKIVHAYLVKEMCAGKAPAKPFDLFAVEGGTAAMCYLFDSCMINGLLKRGDKIAIMAPIFTPYLEIPKLDRYSFDVLELQASKVDEDGFHTWQYPDSELEKLADPSIKTLFLVNPSNPPSVMLSARTIKKIAAIVNEKNPGLTVITDDVYGTFVNGFESLMSVLPRNTLGVYSFSKYFGCTGWRLGVIAVNQDNIFDEKLAALPAAAKKKLNERYATITLEPEKLKFIDRLVADSRQVALNHTAGLSLPQQTQMALFALFALTDPEDQYKRVCQGIIARRLHALTKGLKVPMPRDPNSAHYYVELDLLIWTEREYGKEFTEFMVANYEPVDVLFRLAENNSIVLLNGGGFDGPEWSVRISMANLMMPAYEQIGSWLAEAVVDYKAEFDAARSAASKNGAARKPSIPRPAAPRRTPAKTRG